MPQPRCLSRSVRVHSNERHPHSAERSASGDNTANLLGDHRRVAVTSCTDGKHSRASLHYTGNAVDLRIWNIPENRRKELVAKLSLALGAEYDVVLEKDHIHIEYQPKAA